MCSSFGMLRYLAGVFCGKFVVISFYIAKFCSSVFSQWSRSQLINLQRGLVNDHKPSTYSSYVFRARHYYIVFAFWGRIFVVVVVFECHFFNSNLKTSKFLQCIFYDLLPHCWFECHAIMVLHNVRSESPTPTRAILTRNLITYRKTRTHPVGE